MDLNTKSLICNTVTDFPDMQYFQTTLQADLLWDRAAVFAASKAQRRWTLLFSVCRWFSIRRIVAKKAHGSQKRRSVLSHLHPLQNPRGIHSTRPPFAAYNAMDLNTLSPISTYMQYLAASKAQRRWTLLFSVCRWFSIRRIVAKKAHGSQNQRSVLSHLHPLQNARGIHSTRPPFTAYNAMDLNTRSLTDMQYFHTTLQADVVFAASKAQRRWTLLFSVCRWFSIRRIVAKKVHGMQKQRYISVLSRLYPLQNPRVWDGGDVKEGMEANGFWSEYGTILALSSSRRTSRTNLGLHMQPEISHAKDEVNSITYEELEKHFGKKLEDVAQFFDVSRSTFKRICRKKGIRRWKWSNRSKVYNSPSRRDPPCSDLPTEKLVATAPHMTPLVTPPAEARTITVKATCGDDMIKFQLPFSSRMMELEEEVSKRLKLDVGTYKIKYTDDDGDRILIACDKDLQDCMSAPNSLEMNKIKMFIEPITNNL